MCLGWFFDFDKSLDVGSRLFLLAWTYKNMPHYI
jgi:hypothetical protein